MKTNHLLLTAVCAMTAATAAFAGDTWDYAGSGIEIGGGYEVEALGASAPHSTDSAAATRASDSSRSGGRLVVSFRGIDTHYVLGNGGAGNITFIPISLDFDTGSGGYSDNFGRVAGMNGQPGIIRKAVGALLEGNYEGSTGIVSFRGKIARVDYDRDKGFWDWKALDAEVVVKKAYPLANGQTVFDIEVSVGAAVGGVYMNSMTDVEHALGIAGASNNAFTLNPLAAMHAGFHGHDWKVELVTSAEERLDLTGAKPSYLGNAVSAQSQHLAASLDGEFVIKRAKPQGAQTPVLSVYANATADYDNLTLSHMFLGTSEAFTSFRVTAGLRGKF